MATLRVAMIGYGAVAGEHASVLAKSPAAELVAVIGLRREAAGRFAAAYGDPPVFADLETALEKTDLDAVIIASPTDLHLSQAQAAVNADLHALIEFPLKGTHDEVRDLFRSAGLAHRTLAVAHTSRFIWTFRRTKELIESAALGRCKCVSYLRLLARPPGTGTGETRRSWNDDILIHHSAHVLDLCQHWFGTQVEPVGVVASSAPSGRRNSALLLRGPGSLPISAALTYDASYYALRVTLTMQRGVIDIDGFARLRVDGNEETTGRPQTDDDAYRDAIARQDAAFLAAAREERPFPVSSDESIQLNDTLARALVLAEA